MNWRKLRTFLLTVLVLCLIPATRYYQIDEPLLRYFKGTGEVDPLALHLSGEFVENNLGTQQNADGSVTVRMIAQQYLFVPHCILVPAGVPVHLRITSADAVHALAFSGAEYNVKVLPDKGVNSTGNPNTRSSFDMFGPGVQDNYPAGTNLNGWVKTEKPWPFGGKQVWWEKAQ